MTEYLAHIRQSDHVFQTVEAHLLEVKLLAEQYGDKIGVKHIAGLAGMLHDLGKFTDEFRDYLLKATANRDDAPRRGEVDHSTAGGKLLFDLFKKTRTTKIHELLAEIVGNAIISHHSYLHDFLGPQAESGYLDRVRDKPIDYSQAKALFFEKVINERDFQRYVDEAVRELEAYIDPAAKDNPAQLMFLTKYVFSALIDADRTNTRMFEEDEPIQSEPDRKSLFQRYYDKLLNHLLHLQHTSKANPRISKLRQQMSAACEQFAQQPSDIYTLSIPTGGGKTLASLRYALRHAIDKDKTRIIYVVPYLTIIEQNAQEVRDIIQDDAHLLEHHSNVADDSNLEDDRDEDVLDTKLKLKLARDNWDSPIIFTTLVQFLNTFYTRSSRDIRRLHNLSNAIIIFDEVQKVPISCISLFNRALNFLKNKANASIVLCTATQPALHYVRHKLNIAEDAEMVKYLPEMEEAFRRVEIIGKLHEGTMTTERLAEFVTERIQKLRSVLVILNTKEVVKKLYECLAPLDIPVYHLSTSMCAEHRQHILEEIRQLLSSEQQVICISTQLIEAGVDISFDCVVRSLAGLDSIAQAAGRCNRHGRDQVRQVYVVDHAEENLGRLKEIAVGKHIAKNIFEDLRCNPGRYGGEILGKEAMDKYFEEYYTAFEPDLDYTIREHGVKMTALLLSDRQQHPYFHEYREMHQTVPLALTHSHRTAADYFKVIDDATTAVIVPYRDGREIIAELNGAERIDDLSKLLRRAQRYTINVHSHELKQLGDGVVELLDGKVLALKDYAYSDRFGLDVQGDSGGGLYFG
jgi:CRISPR-associated endonuclease/helicase Cas3